MLRGELVILAFGLVLLSLMYIGDRLTQRHRR
jgi:hypothetical protein